MAAMEYFYAQPVADLPFVVLEKLSKYLDISQRYRYLADQLGYSPSDTQVIVERTQHRRDFEGSVTRALLNDYGYRRGNGTIQELQRALERMPSNFDITNIIPQHLQDIEQAVRRASPISPHRQAQQQTEPPICECEECKRIMYAHQIQYQPNRLNSLNERYSPDVFYRPDSQNRPNELNGPSELRTGVWNILNASIQSNVQNRSSERTNVPSERNGLNDRMICSETRPLNHIVNTVQPSADNYGSNVHTGYGTNHTRDHVTCVTVDDLSGMSHRRTPPSGQSSFLNSQDETSYKAPFTRQNSSYCRMRDDETVPKCTSNWYNECHSTENTIPKMIYNSNSVRNRPDEGTLLEPQMRPMQGDDGIKPNYLTLSGNETTRKDSMTPPCEDKRKSWPAKTHSVFVDSLSQASSDSVLSVKNPPKYSFRASTSEKSATPANQAASGVPRCRIGETSGNRVFLTYCLEGRQPDDETLIIDVAKLSSMLHENGIAVTIDMKDCDNAALDKVIGESHAVVICLSPGYQREISADQAEPQSDPHTRYIFSRLRDNKSRKNPRAFPVLFTRTGATRRHIPNFFSSSLVYTYPEREQELTFAILNQCY